jgi:hypothetical protein
VSLVDPRRSNSPFVAAPDPSGLHPYEELVTPTRRSVREAARPVSQTRLIVGGVLLISVYIVMSIRQRPGGSPLNYNFVTEGATINMLSSLLMLTAGGLAGVTFWTVRRQEWRTRLLWGVMTLGFPYLAADEVLQFHERFGDFMDAHAVSAGPFRNWNDIMVIAYGLIAIPFAIFCLPELRRYPRVITMLGVAAFFYVATTAVDSTMNSTGSTIVEESLKLYCSLFMALSMRTGLAAAEWFRLTHRAETQQR